MAALTNANLKHQVIYQIFTRNYKGGTFRDVKEDLDRIQALGVDIIYLLPIQPCGEKNRKGSVGSPYAIKDYRAIDPSQGTMEDFVELCRAVHDRSMKIIIDVVYNHTSPDSRLAKEHPDWFYHKPDGSLGNRIGEWWDVVDLDYSNRDLWRYQIDTLKLWAGLVDGFRCDVAPLIPLEFWLQARKEVEEVRPGCIWLAESIEPEFTAVNRAQGFDSLSDGELYQAFDICYDHDVYYQMKHAITGEGPLSDYLSFVNLQEAIYPANAIRLRFLENHDRPRAAALIPDERTLRNWTAWSFFAKGTVLVYSGQEFEDTHHPTLFEKDPIAFDTGKDISAFIRKLSEIRRDPLFEQSVFHAELRGKNKSVIVARLTGIKGTACEGREAVGIFQTSPQTENALIDLPNGTYRNEISGQELDVFEGIAVWDNEPVILFTDEKEG